MEGSIPQPLKLLAAANSGKLVIESRMARNPTSVAQWVQAMGFRWLTLC